MDAVDKTSTSSSSASSSSSSLQPPSTSGEEALQPPVKTSERPAQQVAAGQRATTATAIADAAAVADGNKSNTQHATKIEKEETPGASPTAVATTPDAPNEKSADDANCSQRATTTRVANSNNSPDGGRAAAASSASSTSSSSSSSSSSKAASTRSTEDARKMEVDNDDAATDAAATESKQSPKEAAQAVTTEQKAPATTDEDTDASDEEMDEPKQSSPSAVAVTVDAKSATPSPAASRTAPVEKKSPPQKDASPLPIDAAVAQSAPTTTTTTTTPTAAAATADIPENILSPPKSETNTATTSTSSSPASEAQMSPAGTNTAPATPTAEETPAVAVAVAVPKTTTPTTTISTATNASRGLVQQPINVLANGSIPKSGKPLMSAMNKKLSKAARPSRARKPKALVAMYESEISDNKIGIKLCIKKSDAAAPLAAGAGPTPASAVSTPAATATTAAGTPTPSSAATLAATPTPSASSAGKQQRKRSRKAKQRPRNDSDDSEYETKRKKERAPNNNAETARPKKVSFSGVAATASELSVVEPVEQTAWGEQLPEELLYQIFQLVVEREGCLPSLVRLGRVCALWRRVSLSPSLWRRMDLSMKIRDKYRTEVRLKWFVDNRCSGCADLNVSNWKVTDINCFLGKLAANCTELAAITLAGWKNFTSDHLAFLVDNMKKLERLDLSSVNVEMNANRSAVGPQSLCNALQTMNGRLTHLYLAHNRLAGIPQIVTILAAHCPNLVLLDLSNVTTQATSHGILHIEKLQQGCRKLKVLRVTNSHLTLGTANMQEMMDSEGFPDLEELSVAALTDESRVVGDEHLQRILKTSSKLKLLDVRGCTRLTHESLIRLPAWDIKHLFLSGCSVTRDVGSGLELIASKWAHSLIELDLAWANVQAPLDNALRALAEKGSESPLAHLNLCGSSVSDDAVKDILTNCAQMSSINLSSCRGLPRGVKRLMQGPQELHELREVLKVQVKLPQLKQETVEDAGGGGTSSSAGAGGSSRAN